MPILRELPQAYVEMLKRIREANGDLARRYQQKMVVNSDLDRSLVSYQANQEEIGHRWCKYREGFSAELIRYVIEKARISRGRIFDPFAGSGITMFVAAEAGLNATGIELLPSSAEIMEVRNLTIHADRADLIKYLKEFLQQKSWETPGEVVPFRHIRITAGAFPPDNDRLLGRYLFDVAHHPDPLMQRVLRFAAMCILEQISFTRKDGQYLRWDQRSGRCLGKKPFDKRKIHNFTDAVTNKIRQIIDDLEGKSQEPSLFPDDHKRKTHGDVEVLRGSCLDILPQLKANSFSGLITSPPYCNRYDYTRTYALELAMLGVGEEGIRDLRQAMLSCTVENKQKLDLPSKFGRACFDAATKAFESQRALSLILEYLEMCKKDQSINNPGIVRMVRNYFFELALVIFASVRALKPDAPFVMVNDNVRYQGAQVPVDLILSDFAEQAGFTVETIWVLPRGKGNSSQQMGMHGREEVRKCVYVWRKLK